VLQIYLSQYPPSPDVTDDAVLAARLVDGGLKHLALIHNLSSITT
jgi:hypothetical protein